MFNEDFYSTLYLPLGAKDSLGLYFKTGYGEKLGLAWRNRKKISQIINDYLYLPFFLLFILWLTTMKLGSQEQDSVPFVSSVHLEINTGNCYGKNTLEIYTISYGLRLAAAGLFTTCSSSFCSNQNQIKFCCYVLL
jgi:hypothetical protein